MRVYDDAQLSFGGGGEHAGHWFCHAACDLLGRPLEIRGMPLQEESYEDKKLVIILLPMAELVP